MNLNELRQKYPQYNDMSDQQLADAYHQKYYSDLPKEDFYSRIGFKSEQEQQEPQQSIQPNSNKIKISQNYKDYLKGLGIGGLQTASDIGASIAQAPSDIYTYLTGKEGYKAPRPNLDEFSPQSAWGRAGHAIGEFTVPLAAPVASGEYLAAKVANPILKQLTRFGVGAGVGALESENRPIGALIGAAGSTIAPIAKGVGKAYKWLTHPSETLKNISGYEKKLVDALANRSQGIKQFEQEAEKTGEKILPQKQFVETAEELSRQFGKSKENINKYVSKAYGEFEGGLMGQKSINKPYELNELKNSFADIAEIPKSTQKEATNLSPKIKLSHIIDDSGKPIEIEIPAKNTKIQDYIRFMRETRDAAHLAFNKAKSENVTQAEKEKFLDTGRKLQKISNETSNKIGNTLSPEEAAQFKKINKFYENVAVPMKYNPVLRKTAKTEEKLGRISEGIYHELLQPENAGIRNYLFGNKDFQKAMLEHQTMGKKNPFAGIEFGKKVEKIESMLKDKILSGFLSKENKEQLQRIVDMNKHQNSILKQMDEEAKKLGITRAELEKQVAMRKNLAKGIAIGGIITTAGKEGLNYIFPTHRG